MFPNHRNSAIRCASLLGRRAAICAGTVLATVALGAWAQPLEKGGADRQTTTNPASSNVIEQAAPITLKRAFDAAWSRQPEAQSFAARQEAVEARRAVTQSWAAEPATLELSTRTDQLNRGQGAREHVLGVAIPLWLPGERSRSAAVIDAESRSAATRVAAAKLRIAATVRDAFWAWVRAREDLSLAQDRVSSARALAADVSRRVKAGDLARADQHQTDGQVAAAESALAESQGALTAAAQQLRALAGIAPVPGNISDIPSEALPSLPPSFADLDAAHPHVADLVAQAEVARRTVALTKVQTRANPELTLSTTRERGISADPYQQSITLGVRVPFGSDARYRAKLAGANADALELESQTRLARERVLADLDAVQQRVMSAKLVNEATARRAQLARETRGFFEKSFRAGESDLPTRLRIELEAVEAERQAARTRIDYAAAISALRQTLGLLPE